MCYYRPLYFSSQGAGQGTADDDEHDEITVAEARLIASPYPSRCGVSAFTNHREIKKRRRKPKEERMKGNSLAYGVGLGIYFTGWARARGQRISSVQDMYGIAAKASRRQYQSA